MTDAQIEEAIATAVSMAERAPLVNPSYWAGFPSTGGLYTPDQVIDKRGWEIYDEMRRRDPRVANCARFLIYALVSGGQEIVPGDDTPEAEARAKQFRWNVESGYKGEWSSVPAQIAQALFYGCSINEKVHQIAQSGPQKGMVYLWEFKDRHPQHFHFDQDVYGNLLEDGLVQFWHEPNEKRHNPADFVIYAHDSEFGNLYGRSMLQPVYEAYFARQVLPRQVNVGIEKMGLGGLIVTVPKGTSSGNKNLVLARAKAMHGASVYVREEGETWEPTPFDASGFGFAKEWLERYDNEVAFGLTFPPIFWNASVSAGSYGRAEIDLEVAVVVWSRYQRQLDEVINEHIIKPIDYANNGDGPCPKHKLKAVNVGGIKALLSRWDAMAKAGKRPTGDAMARELGMAPDDIEDRPQSANPFGDLVGVGSPAERRARVGAGEDELSERETPVSRVQYSEIEAAHESNARTGVSALREAIRAESERIRAAVRKESDDGRRPLATRRLSVSSGVAEARCGGSRRP